MIKLCKRFQMFGSYSIGRNRPAEKGRPPAQPPSVRAARKPPGAKSSMFSGAFFPPPP
jgi:hypothetical protein